jgi:DNA phosphorothioation-associated putative methyltransferase
MSAATPVARHKTAIARSDLSRPIRLALEDGLISSGTTVFDYGCGLGDDVRQLRGRGFECSGWDPVHRSEEPLKEADVVNLGYVVNVIENPSERVEALRCAWELSTRALIVSARLTLEQANGHSVYGDGYLTTRGTFQKYYDQHELRSWIDESLGVASLAAAPGIFYVFRDSALRESFAASRFRRRIPAPRVRKSDLLYAEHREILEPLVAFMGSRGRLPDETELSVVPQICQALGSLRRAFGVIRHATDDREWDRVREERAQDLLVYLALVRFDHRPKYSELPRDLSLDVRAFFPHTRTPANRRIGCFSPLESSTL